MSPDPIVARRLDALEGILACPMCAGPVSHRDPREREGLVAASTIICESCGEVGVVRGFRPSFHIDDLGDGWMPAGQVEELVDLQRLITVGSWARVAEGLLGDGGGATISGLVGVGGAVIEFGKHAWSGTVHVTGPGTDIEVDLYADEFDAIRIMVGLAAADDQISTAQLNELGREPGRNQLIVRWVWQLSPIETTPLPVFEPSNAGNPYPPRFEELLAGLPPDAVVVDIGGGDRRHPDPRVLNFEYMRFDRPDFFGSGLQLPIRSDSVDLVLSPVPLLQRGTPWGDAAVRCLRHDPGRNCRWLERHNALDPAARRRRTRCRCGGGRSSAGHAGQTRPDDVAGDPRPRSLVRLRGSSSQMSSRFQTGRLQPESPTSAQEPE